MTSPSGAASTRLFVALDFPAPEPALALAAALAPIGVGLKVGLELYTAGGPALLGDLTAVAPGAPVFLDLKFHDIPNTVAGAIRSTGALGASLVNLHVAGGEAMVRAAVSARDEIAAAGGAAPRVIGVTVLTSLDGADLRAIWGGGLSGEAGDVALRLAGLARDWGLDGVVASPREAAAIRAACGQQFLVVTPGVRPAGAERGDQKRTLTPGEALAAGASHLVVGRPVTRAADPRAACEAILADMATAIG